MNIIKKQIEDLGLETRIIDKRYIWVKAKDTSIKFDAYELFGLKNDDLILTLKNKFYQYNIKIDLLNPEKNKNTTTKNNTTYETVNDKKKKIRKLLKNKFKLIT